jgi:hypothetical protein
MKTLYEIKGTLKRVKSKLPDPPMVVLLKRKAIRTFPDGQRVALYHNDQLKLDVSVPYYPDSIMSRTGFGMMKEDATIWKKIGSIAKGKPSDVQFPNGAVLKNVQPSTAASIMRLRDMINTYNKKRLADKVNASPSDFDEVVKFVRANEI